MDSTTLNIRTDKEIKADAEELFEALGLNEATAAAIAEGRAIARDPAAKGYRSISDLKAALDV